MPVWQCAHLDSSATSILHSKCCYCAHETWNCSVYQSPSPHPSTNLEWERQRGEGGANGRQVDQIVLDSRRSTSPCLYLSSYSGYWIIQNTRQYYSIAGRITLTSFFSVEAIPTLFVSLPLLFSASASILPLHGWMDEGESGQMDWWARSQKKSKTRISWLEFLSMF